MSTAFRFGEYGPDVEHRRGDEHCPGCWEWYPQHCAEIVAGHPCGGLVHAHFADEDPDGGYWKETKCERCGEAQPNTVEGIA